MAREGCPDCDDTTSILGSTGNGKCHYCHGKGWTYEVVDHIVDFVTQGAADMSTPCSYCNESGVCQTCDGKGYIED